MNILFYQDTLGVGGGEIWATDTALKMRERGHNVVLGCPSGSWMQHQAEAENLPYFNYLIEPEFESHLQWQLTETLRDEKIDLICCSIPGTREEAPLLNAAIREAGRGSILIRLGVSPGEGALTPERVGLNIDTVRGIMVVSREIKQRLTSLFPSMPSEHIHLLYNGVDTDKFNPESSTPEDRKALLATYDIPEHHTVIGAVGRLDRIKNLSGLIQAAPQILKNFPDTTFLIAGEGAEKQNLSAQAKKAGLENHVVFTGFVNNMPKLMHSIDILAHTALSEGVPNVVLEAMAMGKPVVATEVGGVPELIIHEKNGLLIPPDDAETLAHTLCDVLKNPQKQTALGRAARHHAETTFNREAKRDELEALFQSIVDNAPAIQAPLEPVYDDLPDLFIKTPF